MRKLRPILARVLIAGLVGVVVTVGVAVACAMMRLASFSSRPQPACWIEPTTDRTYLLQMEVSGFGTRGAMVMACPPNPQFRRDFVPLTGGPPAPIQALPREVPMGWRWVRVAGWPCDCVWGASVGRASPPALIGAVSVGRPNSASDFRGVCGQLPIAPIWSGLAINTLFYGTIAWVLMFLPGTLRRWRRARAGRCVKCGYDRAGLAVEAACPECGGQSANVR